ncbi:MAG: hypothetical protein WC052_05840 [Patescibacteria group bacterium]
MSIEFTQQFLVLVSFFVLLVLHGGIAAVCRLYKDRYSQIGSAGFVHAIVTLIYTAFYPVWFPQGITP